MGGIAEGRHPCVDAAGGRDGVPAGGAGVQASLDVCLSG